MTTKQLKLRRADTCCLCQMALAAGTPAIWDSTAKTVTCQRCADADTTVAAMVEARKPVDVGVAGASARAMGQKKRDAQLAYRAARQEAHPLLGRIQNTLEGPPTAGAEWLKGAVGEEIIGSVLDSLCDQGVLPLHDRRVPRSSANIDHIAVTPNGVWVIDPKRYRGKVETRDKGGWFSSDIHLYVNGRDRTKLVTAMHKQRTHVRAALAGTEFADAPVFGALCFVDSEWGLFKRKPYVVNGVVVSWGKALWPMVTAAGDFDANARDRLHRLLAKALPSK
jgi:hypothetical protein